VDITEKPPAVLSLCSGYGGIEKGLERVFGKVSVIVNVEVEAFAIANLVDKMETGQMAPAPIWTDLKTFKAGILRGMVDILTGGYPCQPFSAAGKRQGANDPRHLWPYVREIVGACEPRWVFFENVEGHLSLGIDEVLSDLEKMGYRVTAGIFSAVEVGAPHQRKRVFILGKLADPRGGEPYWIPKSEERWKNRAIRHPSQKLAYGTSQGLQVTAQRAELQTAQQPGPESCRWPTRPGEQQHEWEEPRTVADGQGANGQDGQ
jgi:DNA (cytosine-5)-methyltransferase 1